MLDALMVYAIYGHISYILEANSKRSINIRPYFLHSTGQFQEVYLEKKKRNRTRSKVMLRKLNELTFFLF